MQPRILSSNCIYCEEGKPVVDLEDLPRTEELKGIWELCQTRIGAIHGVGHRAEDQAHRINEKLSIDWRGVSA
jgi:hypothetical protein